MHYVFNKDLLSLFRQGYDTLEIANLTGIPEHTVISQLDEQREQEHQRKYHREYARKMREEMRDEVE
jgi:hypothetical protein